MNVRKHPTSLVPAVPSKRPGKFWPCINRSNTLTRFGLINSSFFFDILLLHPVASRANSPSTQRERERSPRIQIFVRRESSCVVEPPNNLNRDRYLINPTDKELPHYALYSARLYPA